MTRIDGWAHTRWGPGGMLHAEAAFGLAGLVVFLVVLWVLARRDRAAVGTG